ncbi:carboxypeptidase-like regulatory domain-containing protein [Halalkalicoccus jeotgali]|uniref:DUF4129 domain-containing protein n=1 Tax=Halalkalicoccus jeotgali (strain DSM 18796 / CECT 7217 / JCM 14584 / KCTC 4019 / B3) TaxID=795797 RepID=L9VCD0_HALJB|nr:carboxypeptidase-like regulatory domain-containing protein [Halalkalicoccus jeotgali]ELY34003.1 hypothetical protein C497_16517 [Halalkalicoccus jeotgali B3]
MAALLCLSLVGGFGVVGAQSAPDSAFQQSPPDSGATNNTTETPRHQDPNNVDEDGNLDGIQQRLSAELAASLGEGSVALSEGEYELARETVGDDYNEQLSRYVELAEESDSGADDETVRQFETAAENQREFADSAEEYEATYNEYQEAVDSGDDERARELARELQRISEETEESGTALEENYANISESSSQDLSEERQNVASERESIEAQQQEVQELEFVGTVLEIEPPSGPISFEEPLVASGTLTDEDGNPIASEEVSFVINDRTVTTTTDADGEFTLVYRPTVLSTDTESLEITYEPDAGSEYADASTTVPVTVEESQPIVIIESVSDPVAFGDELTVTGTVTGSDGEGAGSVPVVVSLGDQRLGEVQTDSEGAFELSTTTPATIPAGEGTLRAELPLEGQALTSAETAAPMTVEETETQTTMTAAKTDDDRVAVSGRLATADGRALPAESVRILVGGSTVGTLETDRTGEYQGTVTPPALAGQSAEITAVYDSAGTNLADSQGSDTVTGLPVTQSILDAVWLPGTILVALGLGVVGWVYRRRQQTTGGDPLSYALGSYAGSEADGADAETPHVPAHILIGLARKCHQNGDTDRAITLAYTAVRNHLRANAAPGWTHWEFYNETASDLDDAQRNTLLSITEQFERATFASDSIPDNAASSVITAANHLIGNTRPPSS